MFSEDLLLTNETGKKLYNQYAKDLPIIDYHCHLSPKAIYENNVFEDLGELWLSGDHYKWRAMRIFGIDERLITGDSSFKEKFMAFAEIMPKLIGNPIYIWCALELKRYFNIDEPLSSSNAEEIFKKTKKIIEENNITPQYIMEKSNVELVCTTDDPIDDLNYHIKIKNSMNLKTKVIPAFRPDKAFYIENSSYGDYINLLEKCTDIKVKTFKELILALEKRLLFFKSLGSMVNDNGIAKLEWAPYTEEEVENIFKKAINKEEISIEEANMYKSAFLIEMAKLYYEYGFVMQFHIGAYRNANTKMFNKLGPDTGFDCTDDKVPVKDVGMFLDALNSLGCLPKTILYPLDMSQFETFATLAGSFYSNTKGLIQLGAPWWFNDQVYGIKKQFESIANLYPISLSVGMLTDSRNFSAYPRHELYRRVLCEFFGELIDRHEYFSPEEEVGKIIQDICYYNAKEYFGI